MTILLKNIRVFLTISIFLLFSCYGGNIIKLDQDINTLKHESKRLAENITGISSKLAEIEKKLSSAVDTTLKDRASAGVFIDKFKVEMGSIIGELEEIKHYQNKLSLELKKISDGDGGAIEKTSKITSSLEEIEKRLSIVEKEILGLKTTTNEQISKISILNNEFSSLNKSVTDKIVKSGEQSDYQQGLNQFNQGEYKRAITYFQRYISKETGEDRYKDKAQFWIGEAYFKLKDYERAIAEYQKVIDEYKSSDKRCNAMLKQGFAFVELKKIKEARLFLKSTISDCKNEKEVLKKANKKLSQLQ